MNAALANALVLLAAPGRMLDVRSRAVERKLKLMLSDADIRRLRAAGEGAKLGAYYHWYLQKLLVANAIKGIDAAGARAFIKAADRTDYAAAQALIDSPTGALVAIPHHAHYILTMTALAMRIGRHRKVKVFYASPKQNKGNAIFDQLHALLFSDPAAGVEVIHNTRQGLAQALKGLKAGEIVFIMPDAFTDVSATMMVPFCGALMDVMLGTATLARKTGAWILPVVSRSVGYGLAFGADFCEPIRPQSPAGLTAEQERMADYAVMRAVFARFERVMANELLLWQSVLQHGIDEGMPAALASRHALPTEVKHLLTDPLFRAPDLVIDLRAGATAPALGSTVR